VWTSTRMPSVRRSQPILTMAATEGCAPVAVPDFSHEEYYVTDYYSVAYPGFTTYEHALVLDEPYYSRYTVAWDDLPLPTEEMQRWALPEGVLPPGSSLSGFLFFEGLHPGEEKVNFLAQFENAETGDYFGAITIPMEAEDRMEPQLELIRDRLGIDAEIEQPQPGSLKSP
jgi:hypothetical protein